MPRNPIEMAKRSRAADPEVIKDKQVNFLSSTTPPYTRPRKLTRLSQLMHKIYDLYEWDRNPSDDSLWVMPSSTFEWLTSRSNPTPYSQPTFIKAKKLLGIRSMRVGNQWCWTYPRWSPSEALDAVHERRLEQLEKEGAFRDDIYQPEQPARPAYYWLRDFMRDHKYEITRDEAVRLSAYNRQTTKRMKGRLGVISEKRDGVWYWVYPAQEVQDWLLSELAEGPVELQSLLTKALSEHGWPTSVVRYSRIAAGGIVSIRLNGKQHWRLA